MSKVQELMNLVQKQSSSMTSHDNSIQTRFTNQGHPIISVQAQSLVNGEPIPPPKATLPPKAIHSNYSDLAPKCPNKTPQNVGWMPGMMLVPPGEGTNRGF